MVVVLRCQAPGVGEAGTRAEPWCLAPACDEYAQRLYRRALSLIPGGVNSPVRAMRAVGLDEPFFVARGEGAYL